MKFDISRITDSLTSDPERDTAILASPLLGADVVVDRVIADLRNRKVNLCDFSNESVSAWWDELVKISSDQISRAVINRAILLTFQGERVGELPIKELVSIAPKDLVKKFFGDSPADAIVIVLRSLHRTPELARITLLKSLKYISDNRKAVCPGIRFLISTSEDIHALFEKLDTKTSPANIFQLVTPNELLLDPRRISDEISSMQIKASSGDRNFITKSTATIGFLCGGVWGLIEKLAHFVIEKEISDGAQLVHELRNSVRDNSPFVQDLINSTLQRNLTPKEAAFLDRLLQARSIRAAGTPEQRSLRVMGVIKDDPRNPNHITFSSPLIEGFRLWKHAAENQFDPITIPFFFSEDENLDAYRSCRQFEQTIRTFGFFSCSSCKKKKYPLRKTCETLLETAGHNCRQEVAKLDSHFEESHWSFLDASDIIPLIACSHGLSENDVNDWKQLCADFSHLRRKVMHMRNLSNRELSAAQKLPLRLAGLISRIQSSAT